MKNRIHLSESIGNTEHEFGESSEPRYIALIVREDGAESVAVFTRKQLEVAEDRARREPRDVEAYVSEVSRRQLELMRNVFLAFITAIAVGGVAVTATGILQSAVTSG